MASKSGYALLKNTNSHSNKSYTTTNLVYSRIPSDDPNSSSESMSRKFALAQGKGIMDESDFTDNSFETTKLRPRSSAVPSYTAERGRAMDDIVYIQQEILPTDTLQSISLHSRVPVSCITFLLTCYCIKRGTKVIFWGHVLFVFII